MLARGNDMELHLVPCSKQPQNLYDIYLMPCVQSLTPVDGWKDLQNMQSITPKKQI